jgi:hypothetical protein
MGIQPNLTPPPSKNIPKVSRQFCGIMVTSKTPPTTIHSKLRTCGLVCLTHFTCNTSWDRQTLLRVTHRSPMCQLTAESELDVNDGSAPCRSIEQGMLVLLVPQLPHLKVGIRIVPTCLVRAKWHMKYLALML